MKQVKVYILCIFLFMFANAVLLAETKVVRIYYEKDDQKVYTFYADNNEVIPYTVKLRFPSFNNMTSSKAIPHTQVIPPGSKKIQLLTITRKPNLKFNFKYKYNYNSGDVLNAKHDDTYSYLIPYKHGTKHKISQGYHGGYTHKDSSEYALDFTMPIGTEFFASRDGIVYAIKEDSNIGGPEPKYSIHGNYIKIYHKDGTFAKYVHLKKNGAIVKKGDIVNAGDLIGYSGNTGRSGGPHLHFQISVSDKEGNKKSIPTKFLSHDGKNIGLKHASAYYATHQGKPKYDMIYGRDVSDEDYKDYSKKVKKTGKVKIRYEKVDDTPILFAANGKDYPVEMTLKLTLTRMKCTKALPIIIKIPPLTEIYVCNLKRIYPENPKNYKEKYRFNYTYNSKKVK